MRQQQPCRRPLDGRHPSRWPLRPCMRTTSTAAAGPPPALGTAARGNGGSEGLAPQSESLSSLELLLLLSLPIASLSLSLSLLPSFAFAFAAPLPAAALPAAFLGADFVGFAAFLALTTLAFFFGLPPPLTAFKALSNFLTLGSFLYSSTALSCSFFVSAALSSQTFLSSGSSLFQNSASCFAASGPLRPGGRSFRFSPRNMK
mmetsp:Transcript_95685/g.270206  ORF Transcript_95685/g.270206 Transcript_95685/m.270206 type:complete len:203 (-) Transcript_95685:3542-4150(-)